MRPSTAYVGPKSSNDDENAVGCSLKEYKILGQLGKGAYGVVYKVISNRDKQVYV